MVAIVVILAAVIASFVFGMAGQTKAGHSIGITTKYSGGNIELMYHGGDGAATLANIAVTLNGVQQADWLPTNVGEFKTYTGPYTKPTKALIVARYSDGSEYIVINQDI